MKFVVMKNKKSAPQIKLEKEIQEKTESEIQLMQKIERERILKLFLSKQEKIDHEITMNCMEDPECSEFLQNFLMMDNQRFQMYINGFLDTLSLNSDNNNISILTKNAHNSS